MYVNGTETLLTSLCAEHNGAITVRIVLHMLTLQWILTNDIPHVTILVDNKEVITRIQYGLPSLNIKRHLALEYNLWAESLHLANTLPFPIKW